MLLTIALALQQLTQYQKDRLEQMARDAEARRAVPVDSTPDWVLNGLIIMGLVILVYEIGTWTGFLNSKGAGPSDQTAIPHAAPTAGAGAIPSASSSGPIVISMASGRTRLEKRRRGRYQAGR